jgi:hypothetical protein
VAWPANLQKNDHEIHWPSPTSSHPIKGTTPNNLIGRCWTNPLYIVGLRGRYTALWWFCIRPPHSSWLINICCFNSLHSTSWFSWIILNLYCLTSPIMRPQNLSCDLSPGNPRCNLRNTNPRCNLRNTQSSCHDWWQCMSMNRVRKNVSGFRVNLDFEREGQVTDLVKIESA